MPHDGLTDVQTVAAAQHGGREALDVTILRLGLSGQRRETAQAARWLDADDQELLALWWLEACGELDRSEITAGYAHLYRGGQARSHGGQPTSQRGQAPISNRHPQSASRHAPRQATSGLRHVRMLAKASVPAKVAALSIAASCAAVGTFAVVHAQANRSALVRSAAAASHVTAAVRRPQPRQQPRPVPRTGPRTAVTAASAANARKGVSAWKFTGVRQALKESGVSWYYTWSAGHAGISAPRGVKFVPMIWGPRSVSTATLSQTKLYGHILLGFNEPDMRSQSNMTVSQALSLWPQLMATGMRLGSPAVADDAATPGGWLDQFMQGAAARGYRVNFITVHWYGGDFATAPAVSQLKSYLQAIRARYHKPIWLTEYALASFGAPASFPSQRLQAAFVRASTTMLRRLSYVQRYAWFALPAPAADGSTGLFRSGPAATRAGRAFEAVP